MVVFGQASGASNTVSLDLLMDRSIGVIGYWVTPFLREEGAAVIDTILTLDRGRAPPCAGGPSYAVGQVSAAHSAIEARETGGKVTLTVDEASWGQAPH
jgi:hypothetical protein